MIASLGFPLLVAVGVGGAIASLRAGWSPEIATAVWVAIAYVTIATLERLVPLHEEWSHSRGDLGADVSWFATNTVMNRLFEPPLLALATAAGGALAARYGLGLWPTEWPLLAQLCVALLCAEFFEYWFHRSMHEVDWLWRFHALHHSAPRLYWLNAVRFHPVDFVLVGIGKLMPLAVLGASVEVFALVNVFSAIHGSYQHANVPVRIGPLNWIFSMSELHRWHHSPDPAEANHNYGGNLIFWDLVFGTRYLPSDREPPAEIGIRDLPNYPTDYLSQLVAPARWRSVVAEAGVPSDGTST